MEIDYRFIDLFAGAGGLSVGISAAGFKCLFANELVPQYADTYQRNHPDTKVVQGDIRALEPEAIRYSLGLQTGDLELLAGGPPCQGFSINAPIRSQRDPRNHLFLEYLRFVEAFMPKAILIENVPGIVSFEHGQTLEAILQALTNYGYSTDVRILGAAYHGVPQMRWRTIIVGLRNAPLPPHHFPRPSYYAKLRANFTSSFRGQQIVEQPPHTSAKHYTTVYEAIGDLPALAPGSSGANIMEYDLAPFSDYQRLLRTTGSKLYNHQAVGLSPINKERLHYIKPGGNWTNIPPQLLPKGMQQARRSDHTKRYGRVEPSGLASTILTKCDPHWGAFIHYNQDRPFTVREAARLQSFPDHYIFYGSLAEQYAQVGNAVPPLLAKAIAYSLREIIPLVQ